MDNLIVTAMMMTAMNSNVINLISVVQEGLDWYCIKYYISGL